MGSQKSQTWLSDFPFLAYNQLNLVKRIPSRNETSWFLELLHFSVSINGDHLEVIFSFYFYFLNPHQSAFCHYHSPMRQLSSITCCWGLVTKLCAVLLLTHGLEPAWLLCPWNFWARLLEQVAISFSRESSQPRPQTHVFFLADSFFTTEPPENPSYHIVSMH